MRHTALALLMATVFNSPFALAANDTTNPPTQPAPAVTSGSGGEAATAPASGTTSGSPLTPGGTAAMTDDERRRLNQALGTGQAGPERTGVQQRSLSAGDLRGKDIHNGQGEKIGDVAAVVTSTGGDRYIVIGSGGFFGIGEDRAALPAERFWVWDNDLVVLGVTEADISAMDDVRMGKNAAYTEVERDTMIELPVWQQR